MNIDASVVVCTFNGESRIIRTLSSLVEQRYHKDAYEIIVIDNNSTDRTSELVNSFILNHPEYNIRYFLEKPQGLSYARNRGIKESRGKVVAFIDDDAEADRNWLSRIVVTFEKNHVECVGGRVQGVFLENKKPEWLHKDLLPFLGIIDYGGRKRSLSYPRYPFGVNIAFKRSVFENIGMFETRLGRKGACLLSGEEAALCCEMEKKGAKILYAPDILVYHNISSERLTRTWFKQRAFYQGLSEVMLERKYMNSRYISIKLIKIIISLPLNVLNYLRGLIFVRKDIRFLAICKEYVYIGYIYGLIQRTYGKS